MHHGWVHFRLGESRRIEAGLGISPLRHSLFGVGDAMEWKWKPRPSNDVDPGSPRRRNVYDL
jgi:hypothetical protein